MILKLRLFVPEFEKDHIIYCQLLCSNSLGQSKGSFSFPECTGFWKRKEKTFLNVAGNILGDSFVLLHGRKSVL